MRQTQRQLTFIDDAPVFPATRFQGSKLKIVDWIWDAIKHLQFSTVLDAFGGTGSVGYMLKQKGKMVTYNDTLKFNWFVGCALIENNSIKLTDKDVVFILKKHEKIKYPTFAYDTFKNFYFTDEENHWIDTVVTNIGHIDDPYKKAIAYFALFQSCIIKRPFNLFHRKNLYIRFADVKRNFGNKATWDKTFEAHFKKFVMEANRSVFSNGQKNMALNLDIFDVKGNFDLVYIDTPYISKKGAGVDYFGFYHFLEGIVNYSSWNELIDYDTINRRLKGEGSVWTDKKNIHAAFDRLFEKFKNSVLVVSYRSDGIPSIEELITLLKKYKAKVEEFDRKTYKYVLSANRTEEVLLIAR
ncbi:MAG: DNA adenine methylase [Deltaproteobacteria bacterium]|nr:DNA adenine methylase [Deltaproteobacteria bacterium]